MLSRSDCCPRLPSYETLPTHEARYCSWKMHLRILRSTWCAVAVEYAQRHFIWGRLPGWCKTLHEVSRTQNNISHISLKAADSILITLSWRGSHSHAYFRPEFCLLVHVTSPSIRGGRLGKAGCGDTRIASSENPGRHSSLTHEQWHQGIWTNDREGN